MVFESEGRVDLSDVQSCQAAIRRIQQEADKLPTGSRVRVSYNGDEYIIRGIGVVTIQCSKLPLGQSYVETPIVYMSPLDVKIVGAWPNTKVASDSVPVFGEKIERKKKKSTPKKARS